MPSLDPAGPRGAGNPMTAGVVAALAGGRPLREALRAGAACGALNVVRHGLGTGGARAVDTLAERVELRPRRPATDRAAGLRPGAPGHLGTAAPDRRGPTCHAPW